jgi:hypothetical protein
LAAGQQSEHARAAAAPPASTRSTAWAYRGASCAAGAAWAYHSSEPARVSMRRPASTQHERALAAVVEPGGGRQAHGVGEPSRQQARWRRGLLPRRRQRRPPCFLRGSDEKFHRRSSPIAGPTASTLLVSYQRYFCGFYMHHFKRRRSSPLRNGFFKNFFSFFINSTVTSVFCLVDRIINRDINNNNIAFCPKQVGVG